MKTHISNQMIKLCLIQRAKILISQSSKSCSLPFHEEGPRLVVGQQPSCLFSGELRSHTCACPGI